MHANLATIDVYCDIDGEGRGGPREEEMRNHHIFSPVAPGRKKAKVAEEKTLTSTMPPKHSAASFSYTKPPVSTAAWRYDT